MNFDFGILMFDSSKHLLKMIWFVSASLQQLSNDFFQVPLDTYRLVPSQHWRRIIWEIFTYPTDLRRPWGYLFAGISIFFTLISLIPLMGEFVIEMNIENESNQSFRSI